MEKTAPVISVIVPCYNQAQYLPIALQSILNQTHTIWECIIVNDGSTDNTEEVALEWVAKDKRFKYLKKENGGLSSARNAGLRILTGQFIQFLDADDIIHHEKFAIQISILDNTPDESLSISSYFASIENDLEIPHQTRNVNSCFKTSNFLHELITNWEVTLSIPVHCFLFKTPLFKNNNIFFNEHLPNHEDWECWMNIFKLKPEVKYIDLKLATYRIHPKGLCTNTELMRDGYLQAIILQKRNFSKNTMEYKLLDRKYNLIKFGVNSGNIVIVYLGFPFVKIRRIAGKAFHFISGK